MLYLRIAAVALTALFVALLIWLYGVKTTLIWAGAMVAFLLVLWAVTTPLRARQRRAWLEMGLGPDGRPLPEVEDDGSECEVDPEPVDAGERRSDAESADAGDARVDDGRPAARP